jgi:hypothetical protein
LFFLAETSFARTQPGKWGLAARLFYSGGTELALSKMASPSTMYLFNTLINVNSSTEEIESGGTTVDGPKNNRFSITVVPERRTYLRPNGRISPFWGIYALIGYSTQTTETPAGMNTLETIQKTLNGGAGLTFGVEYFMSKYFSLSAHSRMLQYMFSSNTSETGNPTVTTTKTSHSVSLAIQAALYFRFYF